MACAFGVKGDRVGLLARGEVGLAGAVKEVERAGGQAVAILPTGSQPGAVARVAAAARTASKPERLQLCLLGSSPASSL